MTGPMEILAIDFSPDAPTPWPVLAGIPPRVLVFQADAGSLDEVAAHARLAMARQADGTIERRGDPSVIDELDDVGVRLFVEAWSERSIEKHDRLGEGLSWDSPGFEPPDLLADGDQREG